MEYNQFISYDGVIYNFDNQVDRFMPSLSANGLPPVNHFTQDTPYYHGSHYLGYKLRPRTIRVEHRAIASTRADYWALRTTLLDAVRFNRGGAGVLRKIFDDGSKRDIEVYATTVALDQRIPNVKCGWEMADILEFTAYNPLFFNPEEQQVVFTPAANSELEFPITFPIEFGNSKLNPTTNINYPGSWLTYPTIEIVGPVDTPTITNNTIGEFIALDYSVKNNETVTIDLSSNTKSISSTDVANLKGVLRIGSYLSTFRIEADPEAPSGVNNITFLGGGVGGNTSVTIKYKENYIGI